MPVTTVEFGIVNVDDCGQSILEQPTPEQLAAVESIKRNSFARCSRPSAVFLQRLASEDWFMDDEFEVPTTDDELLEVLSLYSVTVKITTAGPRTAMDMEIEFSIRRATSEDVAAIRSVLYAVRQEYGVLCRRCGPLSLDRSPGGSR